ncbi:ABC transporter ATP-binding protein [Flavobacterium kingsejongi]|uniref:ABC transporter ATP-binding protein n=1 Tax=Flavobacterium kingsejongi TaxID=1678728 RepID=A0A2S1LNV0_9FLAO|nr:ABC transporter ATP-binding protein [Flavobacterium kingsejongi]AWG25433.1 ABC transporter ATP-binding protein [Flavobacterium kingsejongi]
MLQINSISFSYDSIPVINNLSFQIKKGQNFAVIGESGCGKSTLLKLIYGLHDLDKGAILWEGSPVLGPKYNLVPGAPFMKYLAQDFDLMPYITVAENVGKFLSNFYPEEKKRRVADLLDMVEMTAFANTQAQYLSGGQMQRVALARVLAVKPEILLLDEPFSHIDNFRKNALRRNLFDYLKTNNIACIIATHDNGDALSFADEIVVMKKGEIVLQKTPEQVYKNPENRYVASLFGEVNEIPAIIFNPIAEEGEMMLVYPQHLKVVDESNMKVVVKRSYFKGNYYLIKSAFMGKALFFNHPVGLEFNEEVFLQLF